MKNEWEYLKKYLPADWEGKAKELKALVRRREIKNADDLLILNLLYVTDGGSFQATSEMMKLTAGISLDKNAVYNRITSSWEWLRYLAQEVCYAQGVTIAKPSFLGNKEVVLVDASDMALRGSKSSDYRLHFAFNLFKFQCKYMDITTIKEGEKLSRYSVHKDEIFIADRIYSTLSGIEHVLNNDGDFVLRFKSKGFNLYDEQGLKIELLPFLHNLKEYENTDIHCFCKLNNVLRPIRIVAMKKDSNAIDQSNRKMKQKAIRKQVKPAQGDTIELNKYIVLATNLDYTNEQILELYRMRWQIEQVFYRLKSMFGFGEIPNKNPDSVKAWFYGKLLLASLCEAVVREASFSPREEKIIFGFTSQKFME